MHPKARLKACTEKVKMEYYKEKKQELKEILDLVGKDFPEIQVEIEHEYTPILDEVPLFIEIITLEPVQAYFQIFSRLSGCKECYFQRAVVCATDNYFKLPFEEKLGIMAHELGHVQHRTRTLNPKRMYRHLKWYRNLEDAVALSERLKKWKLLKEIDADTQVANKGYGKGLLSFLKRISPVTQNLNKRIKNLEKIIGE